MNEIRTYSGEVVSVFLSEEENTANISLDLGFRVWKVLNFKVGWAASTLNPGDKVIVDVEMRKEGREHSYRARDIRRDVQQDNAYITQTLQYWLPAARTFQAGPSTIRRSNR